MSEDDARRCWRRRDLVAALGVGVVAPRLVAAQSNDRVRRIGVLMGSAEDALNAPYLTALTQRLGELGWIEGRTAHIDVRWWHGDSKILGSTAAELVASRPDVMVAYTNLALAALQTSRSNAATVFVAVGDPVGSGFVASLARPGGNITGFLSFERAMAGKWLEILKEAAPGIKRVLALYHPETPVHQAFWNTIAEAAPRLGVEAVAGGVHDANEIEHVISAFAAKPDGGVISLPHAITIVNNALIISLERRFRLPSVGFATSGADTGALVAYGPDFTESFRYAAEYVDRILKGEKPGDLPVQAPTKYLLTVNLKTAKEIGLVVPESFLLRADEVIE